MSALPLPAPWVWLSGQTLGPGGDWLICVRDHTTGARRYGVGPTILAAADAAIADPVCPDCLRRIRACRCDEEIHP